MNTVIPQAHLAELDLAGAAISSAAGAREVADVLLLVREWIDHNILYDRRAARIIDAAVNLTDVDVDVSEYDDGLGVLGAHIVVDGQAITGNLLYRIVGVAAESHTPVMWLAELVVGLPCNPCRRCIGRMVWEIAARRAAPPGAPATA